LLVNTTDLMSEQKIVHSVSRDITDNKIEFNAIHIPCNTFIVQYTVRQMERSVINNHVACVSFTCFDPYKVIIMTVHTKA